ncbi:hypothetical protein ACFQI7_28245 [Paenibacillus allorhizosphaerae]|uniref:hypothetical protein n=1 Tax=Paenibacillus allorhizosphaerae TaxID=2849866 RepID=UPI001C4038D9|nr:hypothetical protein [Paenibacillus allorhizosphaerae]
MLQESLSNLRGHFSNMDNGKRILLKDGRIGYFRGYSGTALKGELFDFEYKGIIESVHIIEYESLLIDDLNVKCPSCSSHIIMDGYLRGNEDIRVVFRENITNNKLISPTVNSRSVKSHACYECGFIMLFADVVKKNGNQPVYRYSINLKDGD